MAVDIIPEKVDLINHKKSHDSGRVHRKSISLKKSLNLTATLDAEAAYKDADFVVIKLLRPTTDTAREELLRYFGS